MAQVDHVAYAERLAWLASSLELRVSFYLVHDDLQAPDFHGPELILLAQHGKLISLLPRRRVVAELSAERIAYLFELSRNAGGELQHEGIDTAVARPLTTYQLRLRHPLEERESSREVQVNHHAPGALGPKWSLLLGKLRELLGPLSAEEAAPWDFAAAWLGARDLGARWESGQVVSLPLGATAFEHAGAVYLRAGQAPQRSELYRYEGGQLFSQGPERVALAPAPLAPWHLPHHWVLPCGGGSVMVAEEWDRPPRLIVHAVDPERPLYVQRG